MKFKVGDKVLFLNEKGGGIVTRIVDDQIVHVSVEDGFEIPYAVSDLLKAGGSGKDDEKSRMHPQSSFDETDEEVSPLYAIPNKPEQLKEGVYLAMVPRDQENVLDTPMDFFLLNHGAHQLLFSLFLNRSGNFHGEEFGYIDPYSKLRLKKVERTEIEDWANGMVQAVFFSEGKTTPLPPASATIAFKPVKIYKEDSFPYENLLRKKAMIVELITMEELSKKKTPEVENEENIKVLQEKLKGTSPERVEKKESQSFLDKHKVDDRIAEVDLHIGELTDHFANLSNKDMLNIQMNYFKKCMEEARKERLAKIIFIHGVGNGILKNEMLRFLRSSDGIDFYDAPYARYGMGATEVLFYRNTR